MRVESLSYQKDVKRSLNKMENISLIKDHSLYLKKSARFAGTFSSRASRAARFARKFERA